MARKGDWVAIEKVSSVTYAKPFRTEYTSNFYLAKVEQGSTKVGIVAEKVVTFVPYELSHRRVNNGWQRIWTISTKPLDEPTLLAAIREYGKPFTSLEEMREWTKAGSYFGVTS